MNVTARTVGDVLAAVERACPALAGLIQPSGRLASQYLLSVDGREFAADPQHLLKPGERLLLLSADAGG